jgi:hypothetical protein
VSPEYVKRLAKHAGSWTKFNSELWETNQEVEDKAEQNDEG